MDPNDIPSGKGYTMIFAVMDEIAIAQYGPGPQSRRQGKRGVSEVCPRLPHGRLNFRMRSLAILQLVVLSIESELLRFRTQTLACSVQRRNREII